MAVSNTPLQFGGNTELSQTLAGRRGAVGQLPGVFAGVSQNTESGTA